MITEGYFGQIKNYPETDVLICVSRKYPWFVKKDKMEHVRNLAPSPPLLEDYKSGRITWEEYEKHYRDEILMHTHPLGEFRYFSNISKYKTIRFLCWEKAEDKKCHRFILLDLIHSFITRTDRKI